MSTEIAALQKELAAVKLQLALAVALHDRLIDENRALKNPSIFKPAPRSVEAWEHAAARPSAEQARLNAGWDKHHA